MVRIVDGNSDIGAHVRSKLCYLICSRHLVRSRAFIKLYFVSGNIFFLYACVPFLMLPSNTSTMISPFHVPLDIYIVHL